jgi:hypothetical protein
VQLVDGLNNNLRGSKSPKAVANISDAPLLSLRTTTLIFSFVFDRIFLATELTWSEMIAASFHICMESHIINIGIIYNVWLNEDATLIPYVDMITAIYLDLPEEDILHSRSREYNSSI